MGEVNDFSRQGDSRNGRHWIWLLFPLIAGTIWLFLLPWAKVDAFAAQPAGAATSPSGGFVAEEISRPSHWQDSPNSPNQTVYDLGISKTHQGDFRIGSSGVYTITVSNEGTDIVTGTITVTDVLPNSLEPESVTGDGWDPDDCGFNQQLMTCVYTNTAGLPSGEDLPPLRLSVGVGAAPTPVITNTATVSNTNDANLANNQDSDPTQLEGTDLAAGKTVSAPAPQEGETITYTITASNLGPNSVSGSVLTDSLPTDVTFVRSIASQGIYSNTTGVWSVDDLVSGAQATLRIAVTVDNGTAGDTIVNNVSGLSSNTFDYNLSNNTASASITVPGLQATGVRGRVISNATDQPISGALVQLVDSSNDQYTFTTGANGWYTFTQTITTPLTTGSATVRASRTGFVSSSATIVILPGQMTLQNFALDSADLVVKKVANATTVVPGGILTYTLTISNVGTVPAASVAITDVLPSPITYITDTLGIAHTTPAAHTYVWRLANSIAPNARVSFRIRVSVATALPSPVTALTNSVRVTTQTPEAVTNNNAMQITTNSSGSPNPAISLTVSPTQIRTNQNATYTIKVTNSGTAPMTSVVVEDTFSTYLDISSAKTTLGTATVNSSTKKVTVTTNTLNANQDFTITVVVRANTTATTNQTVANTARLTYVFGGAAGTARTSNSVSLQILAQSTLPGTGGVELTSPGQVSSASVPAIVAAILLAALGIAALGYAVWSKSRQPDWYDWALRIGLVMLTVSVLFGLAAWGLQAYTNQQAERAIAQLSQDTVEIEKDRPTPVHEPETLIWPGGNLQIPGSELDTLPDFPIPTPTITAATPQDGVNGIDTSPINRIVIPVLAVDKIVKYVPYDGFTWKIAGLQQEVAWLGDTSWPGLGSNTALAAHVTLRTGAEGPFRYLSDLRYGDIVYVETEQNKYQYMVKEAKVVEPTDLTILEPSPATRLTLITCTEWDSESGFYVKRYVVHADLTEVKPVERPPQGN